MIRLKFSDFMSGQYDDKDEYHQLYIVHDSNKILYIGKSEIGIWNRWFTGNLCHIQNNIYGELFGTSPAGSMICRNQPASLDWIIELWTIEDCIQFLQNELIGKNVEQIRIGYFEHLMISKLQPSLNGSA